MRWRKRSVPQPSDRKINCDEQPYRYRDYGNCEIAYREGEQSREQERYRKIISYGCRRDRLHLAEIPMLLIEKCIVHGLALFFETYRPAGGPDRMDNDSVRCTQAFISVLQQRKPKIGIFAPSHLKPLIEP